MALTPVVSVLVNSIKSRLGVKGLTLKLTPRVKSKCSKLTFESMYHSLESC